MAPSMVIMIRWCGNNSVRYDGKINQIPVKNIFPEDVAAGLEVGILVRVKWGARTWQGVLVGLPRDPSKVQCGDTCTCIMCVD